MIDKQKQADFGHICPTGKVVGLLGGTFDPPHIGHLILADQVQTSTPVDEVRMVVANQPWQKEGKRVITDAARRLQMTQAAVAHCQSEAIQVSDIEMQLGGPSYTETTLQALEQKEEDNSFVIIIGGDIVADLHTWHQAEKLREHAQFVVVNRPGHRAIDRDGWDLHHVDIPEIPVSSTLIRRFVSDHRSIRFLTPDPVIQHIESWGLYRQKV